MSPLPLALKNFLPPSQLAGEAVCCVFAFGPDEKTCCKRIALLQACSSFCLYRKLKAPSLNASRWEMSLAQLAMYDPNQDPRHKALPSALSSPQAAEGSGRRRRSSFGAAVVGSAGRAGAELLLKRVSHASLWRCNTLQWQGNQCLENRAQNIPKPQIYSHLPTKCLFFGYAHVCQRNTPAPPRPPESFGFCAAKASKLHVPGHSQRKGLQISAQRTCCMRNCAASLNERNVIYPEVGPHLAWNLCACQAAAKSASTTMTNMNMSKSMVCGIELNAAAWSLLNKAPQLIISWAHSDKASRM